MPEDVSNDDLDNNDSKSGVDKSKVDKDITPVDDDTQGLKKALEATRKERDKAHQTLKEQELAKLSDIERLQTEKRELEEKFVKLQTENLRMKIGMELDLPWRLARRISGDTEEEMRSDAADLVKDFRAEEKEDPKDKKRPPNDGNKNGKSGNAVGMTELMRIAAGRKAI